MKEYKFIKESLNDTPDIIKSAINESEDALTICSLPTEICSNSVCQTATTPTPPETNNGEDIAAVIITPTTDENGKEFSEHVKVLKGTLDNELAKPEDSRYFIKFKIKEKGKSDKTLPVYKGIPVSKATETNYVFRTGKKEIKVFDLEDMILEGCGGNPNFHVNDEELDEDEELINKSAEQRKRQQELLKKSASLKAKSANLSNKTKQHLGEEDNEEDFDDDEDLNELYNE